MNQTSKYQPLLRFSLLILTLTLFICVKGQDAKPDTKLAFRNSFEIGIIKGTNFLDNNAWKYDNNPLSGIFRYTRYFPQKSEGGLLAGASYFNFATRELNEDILHYDFEVTLHTGRPGILVSRRSFNHLKLFFGKYFESGKWLVSFTGEVSYLFNGREGMYYDVDWQYSQKVLRLGESRHNGIGIGTGCHLQYLIRSRILIGGNVSYGHYFLNRVYQNLPDNLEKYELDNLDKYNSMFNMHVKLGLMF
jgi:hypothetical protein